MRRNVGLVEAAVNESKFDPDFLKAFVYTEMARGAYGEFDPNYVVSNTILPGNIDRGWAGLLPEANIEEPLDNLRVTARLISEIEQRLDAPRAEDVYSLYNGMAHDRTYRNKETKSTPYFMRRALSDKAWEFEDWALEIAPEDIAARFVGRSGSGPEPDASWRPEPRN